MASADWLKIGAKQEYKSVKAVLRHNSKDTRLSTKIHDNEHINKALTHLNQTLDGLTYKQRAKRYDDRLHHLDSTTNDNKRKDRVTAISLEIPCPSEMFISPDKADKRMMDWFRSVSALLIERYGADNCLSSDVHVDEIHQYYDKDTKQKVWSRPHLHFGFIPEVDGKLDAKHIASKGNMTALNNAIDEMTQRDYGCKFMTGKKARKKTVEQLKEMSAEIAVEKGADEIIAAAQAEADEYYKKRMKQAIDESKEMTEQIKTDSKTVSDAAAQAQALFVQYQAAINKSCSDETEQLKKYMQSHKYSDGMTFYEHYQQEQQQNKDKINAYNNKLGTLSRLTGDISRRYTPKDDEYQR